MADPADSITELLPLIWIYGLAICPQLLGWPCGQSHWVTTIDMNIWISNCQSQGQANWFAGDVTKRRKFPRNRYNYITFTSGLFFVLKSKQLRISVHSFDGVVYSFCKVYSESKISISFWWRKNFMKLSAGSALYDRLLADIRINGSNSVRLSVGSALYSGLIADPYIHINGELTTLRLLFRAFTDWAALIQHHSALISPMQTASWPYLHQPHEWSYGHITNMPFTARQWR